MGAVPPGHTSFIHSDVLDIMTCLQSSPGGKYTFSSSICPRSVSTLSASAYPRRWSGSCRRDTVCLRLRLFDTRVRTPARVCWCWGCRTTCFFDLVRARGRELKYRVYPSIPLLGSLPNLTYVSCIMATSGLVSPITSLNWATSPTSTSFFQRPCAFHVSIVRGSFEPPGVLGSSRHRGGATCSLPFVVTACSLLVAPAGTAPSPVFSRSTRCAHSVMSRGSPVFALLLLPALSHGLRLWGTLPAALALVTASSP
eukprot:1182550-Prorocentrum_minimum.AAC.7